MPRAEVCGYVCVCARRVSLVTHEKDPGQTVVLRVWQVCKKLDELECGGKQERRCFYAWVCVVCIVCVCVRVCVCVCVCVCVSRLTFA